MRISTFFYTLKQGIINIFRNKWFSLASVATISACLFLFGLFYAVITNFQSIVKSAEEGVSVTIFFQPGTTEEQIMDIGSKIEARDEVSKIEYTSPQQAWEYYKENWIPEEFSDGEFRKLRYLYEGYFPADGIGGLSEQHSGNQDR